MAKDRSLTVAKARSALIVASMRRTLVTYGELGTAIGIGGVGLMSEMRHVLDELSEVCRQNNEPSLAALVVNQRTGEPGAGWRDGSRTWSEEVRAVFNHWKPV